MQDPNEQFDALSDEEKKNVLSGELGRQINTSGLAFAIPLWWIFRNNDNKWAIRNGSASLVDFGHSIFVVTAAHVYREYCEAKRTAVEIGCQLGDVLLDPEERLIACHDDLDIATFRVCADEIRKIGKSIATLGPPIWAPLNPLVRKFVFFAGFPAETRWITQERDFATVPYFATTPITSVTDRQITCRFDRDRMIDFSGGGLPPVGYDIGGVSGGPMLMPTLVGDGAVEGIVWRFAGVVVEASVGPDVMFGQVVAVRGHYIQPDGQIG